MAMGDLLMLSEFYDEENGTKRNTKRIFWRHGHFRFNLKPRGGELLTVN